MAWQTPITDRTQTEVTELKRIKAKVNTSGYDALTEAEKTELATGKGSYRISDLNRVNECVAYLANAFNTAGYHVITVPKTDWTNADIPRRADMVTYLENVQKLVDAFYTYATTPDLPDSIRFLNYQGANNIEQVLSDLKTLLDGMIAQYRYSGDIYAGEDDYI